jgi:rhodanese-related sulfurtransferase
MPITHVTVADAHALQQQGHTYVDVRSSSEFAAGHPAGAVNVPLFERDEDTGQMAPNADFVRVMQANFAPDAPLLVACQAGMRSLRAVQVLDSFGFTSLANVKGGFGGARDFMGRVADPGWEESGLPVDTSAAAGARYADLLKKADSARQ